MCVIVSIVTILVGLATSTRINGASLHVNYQRIRCLFNGYSLKIMALAIWSEQGEGLPLGEVMFYHSQSDRLRHYT